jgi:hypothetical protein
MSLLSHYSFLLIKLSPQTSIHWLSSNLYPLLHAEQTPRKQVLQFSLQANLQLEHDYDLESHYSVPLTI